MKQFIVGGIVILIGVWAGYLWTNRTIQTPEVKGVTVNTTTNPTNTMPTESAQPTEKPGVPALVIDATKQYEAIMKTEKGDMTIALSTTKTPITANNFIVLARKNYYNNTIFHRTIKGFMIQGGDPTGTGSGGPGYSFADEPFDGEYEKGTIAMANAGPNTNGSQFFIMHATYPLPKNYVIFGKVTKGLEIVDAIAEAPVAQSMSGEQSKPVSPVKITSVEIVEK